MAFIFSFFAGMTIGGGLVGLTNFNKFTVSSSNKDYVKVVGNSTVTINGKTYQGNNINILNNKISVNGFEELYDRDDVKNHTYRVSIVGNPQLVETVGNVDVTGNSGNIKTTGSVTVGGNSGSINTVGSVTVKKTSGSISTVGRVDITE